MRRWITLDKYEQIMAKMNEAERIKAVEAEKRICICGGCPSYDDCAREKKELLYCVLGKSSMCIMKEAGCICPSCPVTEQMGLTHDYFCTRGDEMKQRGM